MFKYNPFVIILLFSIAIISESIAQTNAYIKIEAEKFKNCTFKFYFKEAFRPIEVKTDAQGNATLSLFLNAPRFIPFEITGKKYNSTPILLTKGSNIILSIKDSLNFHKTTFTGDGANTCNYLLESSKLKINFYKCIRNIPKQKNYIESFITLCDSFNSVFITFHKEFVKNHKLNRDIAAILYGDLNSKILQEKQELIYKLTSNSQNDLLKEITISTTNLNDSALVTARSVDYMLFLRYHYITNYEAPFYFNKTEEEKAVLSSTITAQVHKKIQSSNIYNDKIKERNLFENLICGLQSFGLTPSIDSVYRSLISNYPTSEEIANINYLFNELSGLTSKQAPNFEAVDKYGKKYSLGDFKGKVVYIDIWATWCQPCIKNIPFTHKIQEEFKENKDLIILYISIDTEKNKWENYLIKNPTIDGLHLRLTNVPEFENNYKMTGIPRYILIDKKGRFIDAYAPEPSSKAVKSKILSELAK